MSDRKKTAGKTAKKINTPPIAYKAARNSLTVKIQGKAFETLRAIADAVNATSWGAKDNSPQSIFHMYVGAFIFNLAQQTLYYGKIASSGIGEVATDILEAIDTGEESDTPADKQKRDELHRQLVARGLMK